MTAVDVAEVSPHFFTVPGLSMRAMLRVSAIFVVLLCGTGAQTADQTVDYLNHIKPILAGKCFVCHGTLKQESGLRLDAAPLIQEGGDSGVVVFPGKSADSELIRRVTAESDEERMPPVGEGDRLTDEQISLLRRWIDQGAVMPEESIPQDPREHWAFQPPLRAHIPARTGAWVRNQVDALLAVSHKLHGVAPAPAAPRHLLLRRLYLDLVGLTPTRTELRAFLADSSPDAYERVVDRLLSSPQYGERWGRHWMDVWRYSDWTGYGNEIRYSQRHVWRWRDWILEALNADKGYDRMVLEMLAADELLPDDHNTLRATGFLARNWYKFDRNVWLDDVIEHTGKAFLGMTVKCAKCHDHKYDPMSQDEFFGLRAIFEPYDVRTDHVPGELDIDKDGLARVYDAQIDATTLFFERGDPKHADTDRPVKPNVPAILGGQYTVEPVTLPVESYYPAMREFVAHAMIDQATAAIALVESKSTATTETNPRTAALANRQLATAQARLAAVTARVEAEREKYMTASGPDASAYKLLAQAAAKAERAAALAAAEEKLLMAVHTLDRARNAAKSTDEATSKQAIQAAQEKVVEAEKQLEDLQKPIEEDFTSYTALGPTYPSTSTGRRLALARWIVTRQNPLTARVAVNHIWLRHFRRPLVENVDDFGLRSPRPALAGLLDYLAVEFMEHDWSMKHLHRLIVTSSAYRMSSSVGPLAHPSREIDPDNRLFWRMNPRRMEAETLRDVVLYAAGNLDRAFGGPDIDHTQGQTIPRRSLYFRHARQRQMEFLMLFDVADPRECYRRQTSIRPQQAFALVNSSLALTQSRTLAARLARNSAVTHAVGPKVEIDNYAFVVAAFETLLSRAPNDDELTQCDQFLAAQTRQLAEPAALEPLGTTDDVLPPSPDPAQRARENLVLVLLNHNDFVTVR